MNDFSNSMIRPELLILSSDQIVALMPYFWVIGGTLIALLACVLRSSVAKWATFGLSVLTVLMGLYSTWNVLPMETVGLFNEMMISDSYSHFMNLLFLGAAGLTFLGSLNYLDREGLQHPEYYVLLLFSTIGMMLMVSALDLIVLFIALELMSLTVYTLVAFRRSDRKSNEASLKYFILGGAASAILLYGVALLYGATGSTNIQNILGAVQSDGGQVSGIYLLGAWLVIAGFLFKIAAAPFHMWMPDVYEGAPTPITGFMTTGLKAASFAAFVRVFISLGYGRGLGEYMQAHIHDLLWVSALITMILGNVIALAQTNLKRMLAYSSIAHTGYLMVGLLAGAFNENGYSPVIFYLVSYSVMNMGAFIILSMIANRLDSGLTLQDLSGIGKRSPWLAFAMTIFMFSMAGIPPTAGFIGKYYMFYAAVQAGEIPLVILSVLCSAISVYYYLRVIIYMYMRDPVAEVTSQDLAGLRSPWAWVAVAAMAFLTLQLGILPKDWIEFAKLAVTSL